VPIQKPNIQKRKRETEDWGAGMTGPLACAFSLDETLHSRLETLVIVILAVFSTLSANGVVEKGSGVGNL
jgi:hypothetical protein